MRYNKRLLCANIFLVVFAAAVIAVYHLYLFYGIKKDVRITQGVFSFYFTLSFYHVSKYHLVSSFIFAGILFFLFFYSLVIPYG
nr:MAG TPA: hypothetical protein [Caudoviricetes sp.]